MTAATDHHARILPPTSEKLALCGEALRRGELVGMPTETVYGLAGDAFNPEALARIFDAKARPTFDPLIVHVAPLPTGAGIGERLAALRLVRLDGFSAEARARLERLTEAFWPGPLTLVLPKHEAVPDLATSGLPSVALRMPRHPVARALIAAAGTPLAAPSANRFGRISPTTAEHVREELGTRIDWILDGGACEVGLESTVVALDADGSLRLLRPGGASPEEIARVAGTGLALGATPGREGAAGLPAPGMLESHYAPKKPLRLLPRALWETPAAELRAIAQASGIAPGSKVGLLINFGDSAIAALRFSDLTGLDAVARSLSPVAEMDEAARSLFGKMRELDAAPVEMIFAEPGPDGEGLAHAIADRLRRAAAPRG